MREYCIFSLIALLTIIVASHASDESSEHYLTQANDSFSKGNYILAEKLYDKILEYDQKNPKIFVQRGFCYQNLGLISKNNRSWIDADLNFERAIQDYDAAIKLDPMYFDAWRLKGETFYYLGKYDEAELFIANAALIDPKYSRNEFYILVNSGKDMRNTQWKTAELILGILFSMSFIPLIYLYVNSHRFPMKRSLSDLSRNTDLKIYKNMDITISQSVDKMKPIGNKYILKLVKILPWILVLFSIYYLYIGDNPMHASAFLAISIGLFIMDNLATLIPRTLRDIWNNGLVISHFISVEDNKKSFIDYVDFINSWVSMLNSKFQYWYALIFIIIGYWIWSYDFRLNKTYNFYISGFVFPFPKIIDAELLLFLFLGFVVGYLTWRMFLVSLYVSLMAKRIKLFPKPFHPDKCGGLSPIGNLCLWNVLITAVIGIFCTMWLYLVNFQPFSIQYNNFFTPLQTALLISCITWLVFAFLLPIWIIHEMLVGNKDQFRPTQERVINNIDLMYIELSNNGNNLSAENYDKLSSRLEQMKTQYADCLTYPTWPLNINILEKLILSQAIPVMTFIISTTGFRP